MDVLKDLTCPVCLELFTCPIILPCSHVLCKSPCAVNIFEDDSIRCPVCRENSYVDGGMTSLPRVISLESIIDKIKVFLSQENRVDRPLMLLNSGELEAETPKATCDINCTSKFSAVNQPIAYHNLNNDQSKRGTTTQNSAPHDTDTSTLLYCGQQSLDSKLQWLLDKTLNLTSVDQSASGLKELDHSDRLLSESAKRSFQWSEDDEVRSILFTNSHTPNCYFTPLEHIGSHHNDNNNSFESQQTIAGGPIGNLESRTNEILCARLTPSSKLTDGTHRESPILESSTSKLPRSRFDVIQVARMSDIAVDSRHDSWRVDRSHDSRTVDRSHDSWTADRSHDSWTVDRNHDSWTVDRSHDGWTVDRGHDGWTVDRGHDGWTVDRSHDSWTVDRGHDGWTVDMQSVIEPQLKRLGINNPVLQTELDQQFESLSDIQRQLSLYQITYNHHMQQLQTVLDRQRSAVNVECLTLSSDVDAVRRDLISSLGEDVNMAELGYRDDPGHTALPRIGGVSQLTQLRDSASAPSQATVRSCRDQSASGDTKNSQPINMPEANCAPVTNHVIKLTNRNYGLKNFDFSTPLVAPTIAPQKPVIDIQRSSRNGDTVVLALAPQRDPISHYEITFSSAEQKRLDIEETLLARARAGIADVTRYVVVDNVCRDAAYFFRAAAWRHDVRGPDSDVVQCKTLDPRDCVVPVPVIFETLCHVTSTSAQVHCPRPPVVTQPDLSYTLMCREQAARGHNVWTGAAMQGQDVHRIAGLCPGTDYQFVVLVTNSHGECQLSEKLMLRTKAQ